MVFQGRCVERVRADVGAEVEEDGAGAKVGQHSGQQSAHAALPGVAPLDGGRHVDVQRRIEGADVIGGLEEQGNFSTFPYWSKWLSG